MVCLSEAPLWRGRDRTIVPEYIQPSPRIMVRLSGDWRSSVFATCDRRPPNHALRHDQSRHELDDKFFIHGLAGSALK